LWICLVIDGKLKFTESIMVNFILDCVFEGISKGINIDGRLILDLVIIGWMSLFFYLFFFKYFWLCWGHFILSNFKMLDIKFMMLSIEFLKEIIIRFSCSTLLLFRRLRHNFIDIKLHKRAFLTLGIFSSGSFNSFIFKVSHFKSG